MISRAGFTPALTSPSFAECPRSNLLNFSCRILNPDTRLNVYKACDKEFQTQQEIPQLIVVINPIPKGMGNKIPIMENHIKLTSGINSNSYIRHFQVAQLNFYLFNQEEKTNKKRFRLKSVRTKPHDSR